MRAHCVTVRDPFHPSLHRSIEAVISPCSVGHLAPETDRPFIILKNGEAVLRKDWGRPVVDGDLCAVVILPQDGGGDSDPMRVIAMIAVAVFAPQIAVGLLGETLAATVAFGGVTYGALAGAGIGLAGAMLVNAVLPPPKPPSPQAMQSLAAPSPTYNLAAQGNVARLDSAIPVQYGHCIAYPDFASIPYIEYAGNEQFLYQLFCLGLGEYDIEELRIEDTVLADDSGGTLSDTGNFEDVDFEIVGPNDSVTLFPTNVATVDEVAGQELLSPDYVGPFIVNEAGTQINAIAYDVVAPRGMYYVDGSGNLSAVSITVKFEYRAIDDSGDYTGDGSYTVAGTETITANTTTPQRRSFRYDVTSARYEVRATRTDTKETSTSYGHEIVWSSARGYLPETRDFGEVTLIAVRMRASNQLSQQASRRFNVISTRKLAAWNGSTWDTEAATSSIAWALADICVNADYGANLDDSRVALSELLTLDSTWSGRGDEFNARFDSALNFWEALQKVAQAGRAKPYLQGGIIHFVRDEAVTTPVALFSMRNIVRGSFSIEYILPSDETADKVDVGYWDQRYWGPRRVTAKLSGSAGTQPAKVELFGVTRRKQAFREGMYYAASNRYRRRIIRFSTEMEGFIPSIGDLIAVQHDMPAWGQFADAVSWDSDTTTLETSTPMTWEAGEDHYIGLREKDGSVDGPYEVVQGASTSHLQLQSAPTYTPYTGTEYERTQISFGYAETWRQEARVLSIKPRGLYEVEIECINEDPSVHTAETGETEDPVQTSQLANRFTAPVIADLLSFPTTDNANKALLTWTPAPGADYYQIEMGPGTSVSDANVEWTRVGETHASSYAVTALYEASATLVRVRAVGLVVGGWVTMVFGGSADYMWSATTSDLMWSATDTDLMWS